LNQGLEAITSLPAPALVALGVVVVLQLALQVYSLIDLLRRPSEGLKFGKKWMWALAIVLGQFYGPLIYLALARRPAILEEEAEVRPAEAASKARRAADVLYGEEKRW